MKRILILVADVAMLVVALPIASANAGGPAKVEICHVNGSAGSAGFPPGAPIVDITYGRTITVSPSAVDAHMAHGDGLILFNPTDNPLTWVYGEAYGVAGNSNCAFHVLIVP